MNVSTVLLIPVLVLTAVLSGCQPAEPDFEAPAPNAAEQLQDLTDTFMEHLLVETPYLQLLAGEKVLKLPDNSHAGVLRMAEVAGDTLAQLSTVNADDLKHDDYLTYIMFRDLLKGTVEREQHFWHQFNTTPYAVGTGVGLLLPAVLGGARFTSSQDIDDYLGFLGDLARYLNDDLTRLKGQEERNILLPHAALPGSRAAVAGVGTMVDTLTDLTPERLNNLDEGERTRLVTGIEDTLVNQIHPAIDSLLNYLGDAYATRAPTTVGLHQYPGGDEAYRFAIRQQTTMDLAPQDIHDQGLRYMEELSTEMTRVRADLGFTGTQAEFHAMMREDPRFFATSPEEVADLYMSHIHRIEPLLADYFTVMPKAPYGVKRLDAAQEPGMTFGVYQAPTPAEPVGNYRFNGSKLESRPLVWAASLIFHELIPGHHFHIALAREREDLSRFRQTTSVMYTAFTEGWANYASSLANEMGLLDDPWDLYGWLLFDAFITARLVVDTGLNHLGWSLEKARNYMLDNTFSSQEEAITETLRYATDLPAQALAYKLGYEKIREIRRRQEAELGDSFDIKQFHAATVGSGGLPLPLLETHVEWYMSGQREAR